MLNGIVSGLLTNKIVQNDVTKRNHKDWLHAFVNYASIGEAPISLYFWTGVSTIAGALRRRVWMDQGHFTWVPNFYIILVAPAGIVQKSTTASIGMKLLRRVHGIKFGPDVVTWQALIQSLGQSLEMWEISPGTFMPMSAITIESSEFGNFLNPSDREMVDALVSLWDGKPTFEKTTKTQGNDAVENPFINIIACTTPAWIEGYFPEYMVGGGFTSRCVFVYADAKRQLIAYPKKYIPSDFHHQQDLLVEDLERISLMKGEYVLSPNADSWGETWYTEHYKNKPPHLDNDRFAGYLARKQTHIHKLAMVLSAAKSDETIIHRGELETANALVTALELDMPKVFDKIGTTPESRAAHQLVQIVHTLVEIEHHTLYKRLFRSLSYDDFVKALNSAIQAGLVSQSQIGNTLIIKAKHGTPQASTVGT